MTAPPQHSYDRVPYGSTAEPLAHAPRLELLAALCGLSPAPVVTARVLELGCGTGANLLPLALEYPGATIVGCDLAASAIASAREMARALALTNLDFRHTDFAAIDASWGQFDYIICHDVFSWVSSEVQQRILRIVAERLAPQGVAYLSHDALPGWHLHHVALDMMRHRTRHIAGVQPRIEAARAMLALAAETQDQDQNAYAALIREQYWLFGSIPDDQIYHLLDGTHRAFYHHEFLELLPPARLQWLADADIERGSTFSNTARSMLSHLPESEQPQYMDFLGNRSFRRALLCRQDAALGPRNAPGVIARLWLGLTHRAVVSATETAGEIHLSMRGGGQQSTSDPALVSALQTLDRVRPELVPISELVNPNDELAVTFLLDGLDRGTIAAQLSPTALISEIDERPLASPLARLEAQRGTTVTNRVAAPVPLNSALRFVIQRLDGTLNLAGLVRAIEEERRQTADSAFAGLAMEGSEIAEMCLGQLRDQALLVRRE